MADQHLVFTRAGDRIQALQDSWHRLTGNVLAADAEGLWHAPAAVVAHDTQDPPRFFFGNATALTLFKMKAEQFIGMASHQSAAPEQRAERTAMFTQLNTDDIVRGYSGIRIASDGSRFRIADAVIWNIRDDTGTLLGQAAWFEDVDFLD